MFTMLDSKKMGSIIAFVAINNIIAFSINLGNPYYAIMGIAFLIAFTKDRSKVINVGMLSLYIAAILSIVCNHIPPFFNSWGRLISFILVTSLISPFVGSHFLFRFRVSAFWTLQWLMHLVVFGSLFAYFAGISFGRRDFAGITTQSMLIAPISASCIICACYYLTRKNQITIKLRIYFIALLISSFITLLLAASRTAIAGALVAILVYFLIANKSHWQGFLKTLTGVIILLALTYSYWNPYLENLNKKNQKSIEAGGLTSSREVHWQTRIEEFKTSPFMGIGFASVSTTMEGATFDATSGQVETGSSWLSVLSMMGLFGFTVFVVLFVKTFVTLYRLMEVDIRYVAYLASLLIFWMIHMMAEGYILGAGGFLFFIVWLLLGYIHALGNNRLYILAVR